MTALSQRIRVLVVDDHAAVRNGICDLLGCYPDMEVVGTAADGPGALEAARSLLPDVILLDTSLPGLSGVEVAKELRHSAPLLRIIMLTGSIIESVTRILEGTDCRCLVKRDAPPVLAQVIRACVKVNSGSVPLPLICNSETEPSEL